MTPEETLQKFRAQEREAYFKSSDDLMKVYEAYDRIILALSSGAIGLIFLLIKEQRFSTITASFKLALMFFLASLISVVASHFFGALSFKRMMKIHLDRSELKLTKISKQIRPIQLAGDALNFLSGAAFVGGAIILSLAVMQVF